MKTKKYEIELSEREVEDLKRIRNYFGEHDVTQLEHLAYNELNNLIKQIEENEDKNSISIFKSRATNTKTDNR